MKLSKYIADLQVFLKKHGDLNCYYASDDEGNSYQACGYSGSILYTDTPEAYRLDSVINEDELEEFFEDGDYSPVCVVN
jgi:hypothetical protein